MINLKYPKMVIFMPEVTSTKMRMGVDSRTHRTKLFIPGRGEILGRIAPTNPTDDIGNFILPQFQYLSFSFTDWGQPTSMLIQFSREPKCYAYCNAGIALEINREVERPNFDSEDDNHWNRIYTGEINAPILDDNNRYSIADMDVMVSTIILQIQADFKDMEKREYLDSRMFSSAIARKVYKLEGLAAGDNVTFNVNGTATDVALPALPAEGDPAQDFNTDYVLFNVGGSFYITTKEDFVADFTITSEVADSMVIPMLWVRSNSAYIKLNFENYESALIIKNMPINATNNPGDIFVVGTYEGDPYVTEGPGKFPSLTPERINENFRDWNGSLFPVSNLVLAQSGVKYASFEIGANNEIENLHGASHKNGYLQRLQIIVPYSYIDPTSVTNVWGASDTWDNLKVENPTATATALQSFMEIFSGTTLPNWK